MRETVLRAEGLCKWFGRTQVVEDLSLEVKRGEIVGLLGPNGSGKTTSLRMMLGLIPPDAGRVTILGQPPQRARDRTGYLPEERGLYKDERALDMLVYVGRLRGMSRTEARRRALEWMARLKLEDHTRSKVEKLSHGMQQRLQFIASVLHNPELLILDEPFQGLDPIHTLLLLQILGELRDQGVAIVLSTHQLDLAEQLCDRVAMLFQGRVVVEGTLEEIRQKFAGRVVRVIAESLPPDLPGVQEIRSFGREKELILEEQADPDSILRALLERGARVDLWERHALSLYEVFYLVASRA
ncbi:MAG: ATP-binding cassette domain-containing protein [Thermoflexus sp.]|nr:ATP-binding cassette domain-containing protein [Thermoflexus sp.]MDT7949494.1 ATP-binding cassette domain-containing protein [Thermoflexus sp.]